ncbi:hypothetical protein LMG29542_02110 [Paraburkholderia humisilvae]|uniref:Uncharacterized protein n=1 Tax=Paraburkholderia humisilvae TaxID=627669 RepID=A0A6J5DHH3_9BURK|nr:hypothetical protein LMG29542_02110 [Paraburkholderia humisilvae]
MPAPVSMPGHRARGRAAMLATSACVSGCGARRVEAGAASGMASAMSAMQISMSITVKNRSAKERSMAGT